MLRNLAAAWRIAYAAFLGAGPVAGHITTAVRLAPRFSRAAVGRCFMHKRHGHRAKPPSSRAELATKARVKPSTRLGEVKVVPEDMDRARRAKQLIEMRVGALGEFIGTLGRQANMLAERTPIVGEERNELLNEATVLLPLHVADLLQIFQRTDEQSQARALKALQDALNGVLYLGALFQRASERRKWLTRGRVIRFDTSLNGCPTVQLFAGSFPHACRWL